jgi:hypothetical protein
MRDALMRWPSMLYKLCNCSFLKNHVALVVVGKLVGEIFDVALTSLLPAVTGHISTGFPNRLYLN